MTPTTVLELEITGKCQLACSHCYADSGPLGGHGTMTTSEWRSVIAQAARLGVREVQFIGGEPTLHPDLLELVAFALDAELGVEVYSNLVNIRPEAWKVFERPGVRLATSYYSDDPDVTATITRRPSHARTRANIVAALQRGIPVRAGLVDVRDGQRVARARAELVGLGVPAQRIRTDRVRGFGRATPPGANACAVDELCGRCGNGRAAVSPTGDVWPCVMARWMVAGNVREHALSEILSGTAMLGHVATIPRRSADPCGPDQCTPEDTNDCAPAKPVASVRAGVRAQMPCGPAHECNPALDGDDCAPAETIDDED